MTPSKKTLILGGTAEAREIANQLAALGFDITTSLAGVTTHPLLPKGKIRSGGFGGVDGLRDYLRTNGIDTLLDATHPYAAIISHNAFEAVKNTTRQLVRFERSEWQAVAGDNWISVDTLSHATAVLPKAARVFITTGRKDLAPFLERVDLTGVIRTVEPPKEIVPERWRVMLDRPPHTFEGELALFKAEGFTHIITKNAGSDATRAKLDAARQLEIPVVMVQRPLKPNCETFNDISVLIKRLGT